MTASVFIPTIKPDLPFCPNDHSQYGPADLLWQVFHRANPTLVRVTHMRADGRRVSRGTGFCIGRGKIVTCRHLVDTAGTITVLGTTRRFFASGECRATVLLEDRAHDLAVLKSDVPDAEPLSLANGSTLNPGDDLIGIGIPALSLSAKTTFVSPGKFRDFGPLVDRCENPEFWSGLQAKGENPDRQVVRANMHIVSGMSGGPLLNRGGEAIGILCGRQLSEDSDSPTFSKAIPIEAVKRLVDQSKVSVI